MGFDPKYKSQFSYLENIIHDKNLRPYIKNYATQKLNKINKINNQQKLKLFKQNKQIIQQQLQQTKQQKVQPKMDKGGIPFM